MSSRNWRGHVALGGIASFALFVIALVLYLPDNPGSIEQHREHKQASREYPKDEDASRESRIWLRGILENGRPEKAAQQSEDAKPESGEYTTALDLSAQWATAIAAAEMVGLTKLQLLFGILGLIGLGVTVKYARDTAVAGVKAAEAAMIGAKAAELSAITAQNALVASQRPWVRVEATEGEVGFHSPGGFSTTIFMKLQNTGPSPAMRIRIKTALANTSNVSERREALHRELREDQTQTGLVAYPNVPLSVNAFARADTDLLWRRLAEGNDSNLMSILVGIAYDTPFNGDTHLVSFLVQTLQFKLTKGQWFNEKTSLHRIGQDYID